jgi:hypothetical protein
VKRFLSVFTSLALILGWAAGSFALDVERVALPAGEMRQMLFSLSGPHPKDACWIWMDELGANAWANTANWFDSCCAFKKYVDPVSGFTDCLAPYYPFHLESVKIALHAITALDTVQLVCDWNIEEVGPWDSTMACYRPGVEIWHSEPLAITLVPDWYGWIDVTFPSVSVLGPFFISWHLLNDPPPGQWGWLTDQAASTICWNWINYGCAGDPNWYEWVYDLGYPWNDGNLLFRAQGRPEGNVAVDMVGDEVVLPTTIPLLQNSPNPFNAHTEIRYQIPEDGHITMRIYDVMGQEVRTLVEGKQEVGEYVVGWDGRNDGAQDVASGLYLCRLKVGSFSKTIKMVLLR